MSNYADFRKVFALALQDEGWTRRAKRFEFRGDGAVAFMQVRKWQHGEEAVIDVGFALDRLGGTVDASESEWHVCGRPELLFPDARSEMLEAVCLRAEIHADAAGVLRRLARRVAASCSEAALKRLYADGALSRIMVARDAHRLLGGTR